MPLSAGPVGSVSSSFAGSGAALRRFSGEEGSWSVPCPLVSSSECWLSGKAVGWEGAFLLRELPECGGISAGVQCVLLPLDGTTFVRKLGS